MVRHKLFNVVIITYLILSPLLVSTINVASASPPDYTPSLSFLEEINTPSNEPFKKLANNAPILDTSGETKLEFVYKNENDPQGSTIPTILATGANGDPIIDEDIEDIEGIAVVAVDNTNGNWEYSTNAGGTWNDFRTTVIPEADLLLKKTVSSTEAVSGMPLTYTLTVTNDGPSDVSNVVITDTLPVSFTFDSASNNCSEVSGLVSCTIDNLTWGTSSTVDITVKVPDNVIKVDSNFTGTLPAPVISNTASVGGNTFFDYHHDNNTDTISTTIVRESDLELHKTFGSNLTAAAPLIYILTVKNNGPSFASGVYITDTLPISGVTYSSGDADCNNTNNIVVCYVGIITPDIEISRTLVVDLSASITGTITNTAIAIGNEYDPNLSNNTTQIAAPVNAEFDLIATNTASPTTVIAGNAVTYTIVITNKGPADAYNVIINDPLPSGLTFASSPDGNCSDVGYIECNAGTIGINETTTVTLVANTSSSATGLLINTVSVTATGKDIAPEDNIASASITMDSLATLNVTKSAYSAVAGTIISYTISISNAGPSDAIGVVFTDNLPSEVTFNSASATCSITTAVVCNVGTIVAGGTVDTVISATIATSTTETPITNLVTVTTETQTPSTNITASNIITVSTMADLEVYKTGPSVATANTPFTYTIVVTNNGPSDATNVSLTDVLPVSVTVTLSNATQGSCSGTNPISCNFGTVTFNTVVTTTIVATTSITNSSLINVVTATSSTFDPTTVNNTDSHNISIGAMQNKAVLNNPTPNTNTTNTANKALAVLNHPGAVTLESNSSNLIRFVPNFGFTGKVGISFKAWDGTDGHLSGDNVVIVETGNESAYSIATEEATITIVNRPPNVPKAIFPPHQATNIRTNPTLIWEGDDKDKDPVTYTVAFGTNSPPPIIAENIVNVKRYVPITTVTTTLLDANTTYYWAITSTDGQVITSSTVWSFTTNAGGSMTLPYENNNTCVNAGSISTYGFHQAHTFSTAGDVDWISFNATKNAEYFIEIQVPYGSPANVEMFLYNNNRCDGLAPISQDYDFTPDVRYRFKAASDGVYYIRLSDSNPNLGGAEARYNVSIRQLSPVPTSGVLILVAGRFEQNDPFQEEIYNITNKTYQLFSEKAGYTADRIYYLANDPNLDPDNNPQTIDVDALATSADLEHALTVWAANNVQSKEPFTLVLVGHGGPELFYLNGQGDTVTADELDGWLTTLENSKAFVPGNIVIESNRSGSFIETLSKPGRVILSSTTADGLSFSNGTGTVFTNRLLQAMDRGMNLYYAFVEAQGAAAVAHPEQQTQIEDTGDGIANGPFDGFNTSPRAVSYVGSFVGEANWPPYLTNVTATLTADAQSGELELYQGFLAAEVTDNDTRSIDEVWAVIYGPDEHPDPSEINEIHVDNHPIVTLEDRDNDDIYTDKYDGFVKRGEYRVVFYASDNDGLISRPIGVTFYVPPTYVYLPLIVK